jgi:lysophospholipase L1-like esterase
MNKIILIVTSIFMLSTMVGFSANRGTSENVKILLIGDSTTEGGKPVFENSIRQLLAANDNIPPAQVINLGLGGETAYSLLNSGRYDRQIKGIDSVAYIFLRYGINDWIHRQPFEENFPVDMKKVIFHLRKDFPEAQIIVMTIIPFLKQEDTKIVNGHIANIAREEKLEFFDIYPAYQKMLQELGKHSMTVRFFPFSEIPQNYHELVSPYTKYYKWKDADWIRMQTNEFDPLFGSLPGWYNDKHPNTTGYRFIADETVRYLLPKFKLNKLY